MSRLGLIHIHVVHWSNPAPASTYSDCVSEPNWESEGNMLDTSWDWSSVLYMVGRSLKAKTKDQSMHLYTSPTTQKDVGFSLSHVFFKANQTLKYF